MKFAIVANEADSHRLERNLRELCPDSRRRCFEANDCQKGGFYENIRGFQPDLLITCNLSGFEMLTRRKGVLYNLLDCKSLHLLTERNLKNEHMLAKQLSIAMFFYCQDKEYYGYLKHTYQDIPFLGLMGSPESVTTLSDIFRCIMVETGLPLLA